MMKVTCNHCGVKNDLGRMFCMSCGKRMQITNADVQQAVDEKKAFNPAALIKSLLFMAVVGLVVVALVPGKPSAAGVEADRLAIRAGMAAKYGRLVLAARAKKPARESFDSAELNAFMKARQVPPSTNTPALNFRLEGARLIVFQEVPLGSIHTPGGPLGPFRFSRQLACVASGRTLAVRGGAFGHLPLPGPLSKIVVSPIAAGFVLTPSEQSIEKQLTEILIRDGKLEIAVGP